MLPFGLGTLPVMLGFGMLRSWLERFRHIVRPAMAGLIVVLALYMGATAATGWELRLRVRRLTWMDTRLRKKLMANSTLKPRSTTARLATSP